MIHRFIGFFLICSPLAYSKIQENVIICGVCKDVEGNLPYSIKIIERIGSMFKDHRIIIYENNSTDSTKKILRKWAQKNSQVSITLEDLHRKDIEPIAVNYVQNGQMLSPSGMAWYSSFLHIPGLKALSPEAQGWCASLRRRRGWKIFRIELIARARNIVLDKALSDGYKDFPYVIWIDMDFKVAPSYAGISEAFNTDQEWDAVFAYGVDPQYNYRDWYAFRDFMHHPLGPELLGDSWWDVPKTFSLSELDKWRLVTSAFGGFGIYKKSSLVGSRYSAVVTEDLESVSKRVIDQGLKNGNPTILSYLESLKNLREIVKLEQADLKDIYEENIGVVLNGDPTGLVWRLNSHTYRYPSVCEHVPLHASMIANGHDKLFINPRMLFFYGDQKPKKP